MIDLILLVVCMISIISFPIWAKHNTFTEMFGEIIRIHLLLIPAYIGFYIIITKGSIIFSMVCIIMSGLSLFLIYNLHNKKKSFALRKSNKIKFYIKLLKDGINWGRFIGNLFFHTTIAYLLGQFTMDFVGFAVGKYAPLTMNGELLGRNLALVVIIVYWITKVFVMDKEKEGGYIK